MIGVLSVVGAVLAALVGSVFLSAGLGTLLHRAYGATLVMKLDAEEFERGAARVKKLDGAIAACLWISSLFYGAAVYLVWGV